VYAATQITFTQKSTKHDLTVSHKSKAIKAAVCLEMKLISSSSPAFFM